MPKANDSISAHTAKLPPTTDIAPIDPVIESMQALAERRDHLRQMAKMATEEANRLDEEIRNTAQRQMHQLKALTVSLSESNL